MGLYQNIYTVKTQPGSEHPMSPPDNRVGSGDLYLKFLEETPFGSKREVIKAISYRYQRGLTYFSEHKVEFSGPFAKEAEEFLKALILGDTDFVEDYSSKLSEVQVASQYSKLALTGNNIIDEVGQHPGRASECNYPKRMEPFSQKVSDVVLLPDNSINTEKLSVIISETEQVKSILTHVFNEEESSCPEHGRAQNSSTDWHKGVLDEQHLSLLENIIVQKYWPIHEFESLCSEQGLMMDGAIETINDVVMDVCFECLIEHGNPIEIYPEVLNLL